jgi:hypothetical protein
MYRLSFQQTDLQRDDANRQTTGLLGLVMVLIIVAASLYIVKHLHAVSAVEDCMLSGRSNCTMYVSVDH